MEDKMLLTNCYQHTLTLNESFKIETDKEYALIYFTRGLSKILLDGKAYTAKENSVALIKPHKEIKLSSIATFSDCICIFYKGGEADYLFEHSDFKLSKLVVISGCETMLPSFKSIFDEYSAGESTRYSNVSEIYAIFSLLTPAVSIGNVQKYLNRFLQEAIAIIETYPERHISVNELAEYVNVDRSYLYKLFLKSTGMTPKEYIVDYKLELSVKKLQSKDSKVQTVFSQLGFSSYRTFEKAFKKKYNISPREYRQSCLKKRRENGTDKNYR